MDDLLPFTASAGFFPGTSAKPSSCGQNRPRAGCQYQPPRKVNRILILSHMFPDAKQPNVGPFILEQVRALRRFAKVDARVVSCRPFWMNSKNPVRYYPAMRFYRGRFAELRWQNYEEVPVLYLPYLVGTSFPHPVHGKTYQEAVLQAAPWIRKKFSFQVVHAHTSYLDGSAGLALGRQYQVPFFITEHTGPFRQLTEDKLIRRQTVAALHGADRVWCVSTALAGKVKEHLPTDLDKVATLPNGVDTAQFRPPQVWQPDPARPRLLAVMSLDENKNPLLLLQAFQKLRQTAPGASLTLIGTGPLEGALRQAIRTRGLGQSVRLLGQQSRPQVARVMREECDLLVLCSNSETFGVVLIEALASGKPVVATRCGGPSDIVTAPWLGQLCAPQNVDALAGALTEVAQRLRTMDGARIRQHALDRFDYRHLARALHGEYERELARKSGATGRRAA